MAKTSEKQSSREALALSQRTTVEVWAGQSPRTQNSASGNMCSLRGHSDKQMHWHAGGIPGFSGVHFSR